jgi:ABC-type amino acid transport substrate-binding protein
MRALLFFVAILFVVNCSGQAAEPVRACGGDSNWPPMSYVQNGTTSIQGLSIDVLNSIFSTTPFIALRPWARCLAEAESQQGFDLVMSVFKTKERDEKFLFSRSYFQLTPSYFYANKRFATPPIHHLQDLQQYTVCALHGAATEYAQLSGKLIESGATNYRSLILKIDRGHCEIVIDMQEVFLGFSRLGLVPFENKDYQILVLPETTRYPLHFAVSKSHPHAQELIDSINKRLAQLEKSGRLRELIERSQTRMH